MNKENNKQMLKELIYLIKHKQKFSYLTKENQDAFKYLEKKFFNNNKALNQLSFKTQNTLFFEIGDYCENKTYNIYEQDLINNCLNIIKDGGLI